MLLPLAVFAGYLLAGVLIISAILPERALFWRCWIGTSAGLILFMWLPAIYAYPFDFSMKAQRFALMTLGAIALISIAARLIIRFQIKNRPSSIYKNRPQVVFVKDGTDRSLNSAFWCLVPPLTALMFFLLLTHTLNPVEGGLNVGQSTYGDLCLHLSIATSLRNAPFPPDYALLPGTRLAYPFLSDTLTTSLMLFGMPLRWAYIIPGTVMSALVFTGILVIAYQLTGSAKLAGLSLILLAFCGGFGFLYMWDKLPGDPSRFLDIFTGFYRAPANLVDQNIRWSNLIADMWLPQRTFLGGWSVLLPALSLVIDLPDRRSFRQTLLLAVMAGALPLIHTHSFLALGLFSAGFLGAHFFRRENRGRIIGLTALYLAATVALALPQVLEYTFKQSAAEGFVRLHFNWVNGTGGGGLIDTYLYFWIKNIGPVMLLMIPALFNLKRRHVPITIGAFLIFAVSEIVLFQPNQYDNNKLFYVWYLLMLPVSLSFGADLWRRMKGIRLRGAVAAAFIVVSVFAGALSVVREAVSDYQLFSPQAARFGEYVEESTPADAVFMAATNHNNPVSALAGRKVVCGPDLYLYFHGLPYQQNEADVNAFYIDPAGSLGILKKYGVAYIVFGDYERSIPGADGQALDRLFPAVYSRDGYTLYLAEAREGS